MEIKFLHFQSMNKLNNFKCSQYEVNIFILFLILIIENLYENGNKTRPDGFKHFIQGSL